MSRTISSRGLSTHPSAYVPICIFKRKNIQFYDLLFCTNNSATHITSNTPHRRLDHKECRRGHARTKHVSQGLVQNPLLRQDPEVLGKNSSPTPSLDVSALLATDEGTSRNKNFHRFLKQYFKNHRYMSVDRFLTLLQLARHEWNSRLVFPRAAGRLSSTWVLDSAAAESPDWSFFPHSSSTRTSRVGRDAREAQPQTAQAPSNED